MSRGPPTPQIVIVHARQIVMHERIGVHDLDCRGEVGRVGNAAGGAIRGKKEDAAKSLSAAE